MNKSNVRMALLCAGLAAETRQANEGDRAERGHGDMGVVVGFGAGLRDRSLREAGHAEEDAGEREPECVGRDAVGVRPAGDANHERDPEARGRD